MRFILIKCSYFPELFSTDILRQRTRDVEVKRYFITLLDKYGSFTYTRETLLQLDRDARAEIQKLGGNPHMEAILDDLLNWDIQK